MIVTTISKPILRRKVANYPAFDRNLSIEQRIERIVGYKPSKYQTGVLAFLLTGNGNGACNAVAGSGKSSTLLIAAIALVAAKSIPTSALKVLVFGKDNTKDLSAKPCQARPSLARLRVNITLSRFWSIALLGERPTHY